MSQTDEWVDHRPLSRRHRHCQFFSANRLCRISQLATQKICSVAAKKIGLIITNNTFWRSNLCRFSRGGKSSESVQCAITGPCLRMRHRPSAYRTVPIRKICRRGL